MRPGNPKHIHGWKDLTKPGVQIVTPDPFPSGSAKWNVLAAYGAARKSGMSNKQAIQFVTKLFKNVVSQPSSGSNAASAFFAGQGDVLITYESEAYAAFAAGKKGKLVVPKPTMLIQLPMVATKTAPAAAKAFIKYAHAPKQQRIFAANGYRPVVKSVLKRPDLASWRKKYNTGPTFNIHDKLFGGWRKVNKRLVRPGQRPDGRHRAGGRRPHALAASRHLQNGSRAGSAPTDGPARPCPSASISTYLTVIVVLPIAALLWESKKGGRHAFWQIVSSPEAVGALKLTFGAAFVVVLINAVLGTITAWVLVRDDFRGKSLVNSVIDLPFALPTIVAGLTLLALYGPSSPVGIDVAFTRAAIVLALCFVTLPFVIRTVQPVLIELDVEMEEAARSLGAGQFTVFRRIVLPNILPGILSGSVLAFARALGEIGSIVLDRGELPPHRGRFGLHLQRDPGRPVRRSLGRRDRAPGCSLRRAPRRRRPALLRHEVRTCLGGSDCARWRSATCWSSCLRRSRWSSTARSSTGSNRSGRRCPTPTRSTPSR